MSTEYVHVGRHADILASCRHLGPGDRVTADELDLTTKNDEGEEVLGEDQHLVDGGVLRDVASFETPAAPGTPAATSDWPGTGNAQLSPGSDSIVTPTTTEEDDHGNA